MMSDTPSYRTNNLFIDAAAKRLQLPLPDKADSWLHETYAQGGEDRIVLAMLMALVGQRRKKPIQEVRYLDIGANHPIRNSNTFLLYRLGARGTLVEANGELAELLTRVRPEDQVRHGAVVADRRQSVELYVANYDELSSLDANHIRSFGNFGGRGGIQAVATVPAIHINDLLAGIAPPPDYVSMDVEGGDLDLLSAMDFQRFRPLILQAEPSEAFRPGNTERMVNILAANGYILMARTDVNCIFVDTHRSSLS